jgi:hypothetical protein
MKASTKNLFAAFSLDGYDLFVLGAMKRLNPTLMDNGE